MTSTDHMVSGSNKTPWHGLGTVLPGNLTFFEALIAARLNWNVIQEPVFDGDMRQIKTHQLNRREDTRDVLGIVRKDWEPLQNEQLLEIAEALAQLDDTEFKPVIETAGSLQGGRTVWALVKIGERQFANSGHHTYLLLSNGHDGARGIRGTLTDTRVVCANTLRTAETASSQLFVTHVKGVTQRLSAAIHTLGWANRMTNSTFAIYEALAVAPVSVDNARAGYQRLVGDPKKETLTGKQKNTVDKMLELFRHGNGNEGKTAFDFLNGVTDWQDHHYNYRNTEGKAERRFLDTTTGAGAAFKVQAFQAAKQLAGV
ncbi:DUF932 domain-containing protein [Termitidicoccus mucosus]|uniref:Phage/plasmid-like protein TIGR03299 n=1 Tax=Termitidicoccus mucosus TaxID=1184151 RepID=A0A178IQF6_9BACT|nr:hypothetical protein AW736_02115 [Opitutaceae bacterium TSB47]